MAWNFFGNGLFTCNSGDTKITAGIPDGSGLIILNSSDRYYFTGGAWTLLSGGGSGSGEANTYSSSGTGTAITLTKSGVNLPFKAIAAASTKIAVANDAVNSNVTIDVTEANLTLVNLAGTIGDSKISALTYSKLTSVPTTLVKTDQANTFGAFTQTLPSSQLKIRNPTDTFGYTLVASAIAADRNLIIPLLTANDTVAVLGLQNVFTVAPKVRLAGANTLVLSSSISTVANTNNIQFNHNNASSAEIAYSLIYSVIAANTAAAEESYFKFANVIAGTITETARITKDGINLKSLASIITTGLSAQRTYTLPNSDTQLVGTTDMATLTNKTYDAAGTGNVLSNVSNTHIAAAAAIAKTKLAALDIVNADVNTSAAIDWTKISKIGSALGDIANINLTGLTNGNSIKWDSGTSKWIVYTPSAGSGESNTGANVGTGAGTVYRDKTTTVLNFKTIKAGTGVTITNNTDDVTIDATGAGGGETNTASNFGTSGIGVWKDKNGVDLRFYKLASVNNKLTVAMNATDHIDFTINDANLAIAWSQLSGIPTASTSVAGIVQLATPSVDTTAGRAVQASDTRLSDTRTPTAHRTTHITGGDAFVKTDVMIAASRYLENRADPASDSGAIWINPTSQEIEYWDTLATPVQRTLVNLLSAQTLQNKTIVAGSNTITGIVDANINAHTTSKITTTTKSLLNSAIVYNDQTNTFGAFAQTFPSSQLKVLNPGGTFNYIVAGSAIVADRTLTLPLLTANDVAVTEVFTQTLTNKTQNTDSNTIKHSTTNNAGDLLVNNATKFDRFARGTANQVLRTNAAGTDLEWVTMSSGGGDVYLANANVFTAKQKINVNDGQQMTFYRPINTVGFGAGFYYDFNTSTNVEATYGNQYVSVEDNTNGSYRGDFYVQLARAGALAISLRIYTGGNGGIFIGNNQRIQIDEGGLTGARLYTLPDSTQTLVGRTDTATVTNKTIVAGSNTITGLSDTNITSLAYTKLTAVPTAFTPSAHATSHIAGAADTFAKTDALGGSARYIEEAITDPTADSRRIWMNQATAIIEYWDNGVTPNLKALVNTNTTQTLTNKKMGDKLTFADIAAPGNSLANEAGIFLDNRDEILKLSKPTGIYSYIETLNALSGWMIGEFYADSSTKTGLMGGGATTGTEAAGSDTISPFRTFDTTATINTLAGYRKANVGRRDQNIIYVTIFDPSTTNVRLQLGLHSGTGTPVVTDTPVSTTESAVMVCVRSTDTNYQMINNDGTGAAVVTDLGIVKDTNPLRVMIWSDGTNFYYHVQKTVAGSTAVTGTISTRIPAATTMLAARFNGSNTTAAIVLLRMRMGFLAAKVHNM